MLLFVIYSGACAQKKIRQQQQCLLLLWEDCGQMTVSGSTTCRSAHMTSCLSDTLSTVIHSLFKTRMTTLSPAHLCNATRLLCLCPLVRSCVCVWGSGSPGFTRQPESSSGLIWFPPSWLMWNSGPDVAEITTPCSVCGGKHQDHSGK